MTGRRLDLTRGLSLLAAGLIVALLGYLAIPALWIFVWLVWFVAAALVVAAVIFLISAAHRKL